MREGRSRVRVDLRTDKQDKLDGVRSVLAGSQAVRSFKRLVAALEQRDESEEDGPLAVSTLVDGAVVQLLDGDGDAPRRIAKRITRKQRAALRVVSAKRAPGVYHDCIGGYQVALMIGVRSVRELRDRVDGIFLVEQRSRLSSCARGNGLFDRTQYIWQFIGCFMLPW